MNGLSWWVRIDEEKKKKNEETIEVIYTCYFVEKCIKSVLFPCVTSMPIRRYNAVPSELDVCMI